MPARLFLLSSLLFVPSALANDPLTMPDLPGWSGYLGAGVAYYDVSSNFVTGNRLVDLDNEQSRGLQRAPGSESVTSPEVLLDLRYTFEGLQTQLFAGNLVQDMVRFDLAHQLGVRHSLGEWGIVSAGYVFSSLPTEVWQDPFLTDGPRSRSDRDSQGGRLGWSAIAGSTLGVSYTYRRIDVKEDRAGEELRIAGELTVDEQAMLRRDGEHHRFEFNALWRLSDNQRLMPALLFTQRSIEGRANEGESKGMQLTYYFDGVNISATVTGYYGDRDYDAKNPVFDKAPDAEEYGLGANLFWHQPMGLNQWDIRLGLLYFESDARVEFYDSDLFGASLSLLYRFR
ncbi:DUF2860 domain-containing protein [Ferrimonas sediminicola]|uniref:DUF2860 domain-containing protein n=1 Tax=Ferrimonas sediminicola TaxID=2569538 RepID=A0A4V5NUZ0_9GAMM|nr:DUF2860 family protein [Ferrimonas sediminicola]TKB48383.1 DUF2860 domain-containing protein [Ferrimonas sediminicola]